MKLIIIGNGFDLHHKMPTCFIKYKRFLSNNHPDAKGAFESFKYLTYGCGSKLWSDLEKGLTLDADSLISDFIDNYYPDISFDSDYTFDEMRVELENTTQFIYNFTGAYFFEWISGIDLEKYIRYKDLTLNPDDLYITFNYTHTLETIYSIPSDNILHIHGKIRDEIKQNLLGGGSYHPAKNMEEAEIMDPIPFPPINNYTVHSEIQFGSVYNDPSRIEKDLFNKYSNDEFYGASISQAVNEIAKYCDASYKNLKANYPKLKDFLTNKQVTEIVIMGHSFDGIDEPYYADVLVPAYKDLKWIFYIHNGEDYHSFVKKYGIHDYKTILW